ncbi:efflux RND transporter periplasmic adaptor subunit [Cellvibrio polysaccharolyticus]|uniref:Efflux RND transporter periplasmic adaptor subunit n=1 Tax=Cellvibrio polysaccharolyticus TaxID=2082724 RepID=A0A928V5I5_9GAMM|nr:efflux RND transporter periplasmic adaptor subunit [Cellvibrio polysaccharolyticus]MBE8717002.1 efflux RND transporter periplasmic adaptor subunit [Cellvibrio polysaccharolyticus]
MTRLKSIGIAVLILMVILAILAAIKGEQIYRLATGAEEFFAVPPESVSSYRVARQAWPNEFTAVGTVEAHEGITINAEVAGKVQRILFQSGEFVEAGTLLVEQESGNEKAQLDAAEARSKLADANFQRLKSLRASNTISQSELDAASQQLQSSRADTEDLKTTLKKKQIRAPFSGRLGIRQVDLGKDLQVGSPIVSLQATDRIRVNFPVPQQWLVRMTNGQPVSVRAGDGSEKTFDGVITAIGAEINSATRNATVQSSLENPENRLIPGMAVETIVTISDPIESLVVPLTAVIHAPYGDTVFVIEDDAEKGGLKARQQFVKLGKSRGDFIQILDGLTEQDDVVSAGAFKLYNGQAIVISDTPALDYQLQPEPEDS